MQAPKLPIKRTQSSDAFATQATPVVRSTSTGEELQRQPIGPQIFAAGEEACFTSFTKPFGKDTVAIALYPKKFLKVQIWENPLIGPSTQVLIVCIQDDGPLGLAKVPQAKVL